MMTRTLLLIVLLALPACGDDSTSTPGDATTPSQTSANSGSVGNGETPLPDAGTPTDAESPEDSGDSNDTGTEEDATPQDDVGTGEEMPPPEFGDPGEPGSFQTIDSSATVTLGGESVEVTIYRPANAGPHPIVVFHHGFQLSPGDYASYGQHLSSWGYVVLMPQMPGGFVGGPTHIDLRDWVMELITWAESNAAGTLGGADASTVVVAGHSLGGKISFLTAAADSRVDAIVAIDPVDSAPPGTFDTTNYPSAAPELMPSISAPMAIVGETVNATSSGFFCQPCAPAEENFEQYYMAASSPAYVLDVTAANHVSFLDDPECGFICNACDDGTDDPAVTRKLTRTVMTAFLELNLRGVEEARAYLTGAEAQSDFAGLATFESKNGF